MAHGFSRLFYPPLTWWATDLPCLTARVDGHRNQNRISFTHASASLTRHRDQNGVVVSSQSSITTKVVSEPASKTNKLSYWPLFNFFAGAEFQ